MPAHESFALIARPLSNQYHHVAPVELDWASEKEFLYAQIFRPGNEQVIAQIEAGNVDTIESIRRAARSSAAMGLTMNPVAALVYFIPRRARKRDAVTFPEDKDLVTYQRTVPWIISATPSYRGLAYVCTHYAGVLDVVAEVVYAADKFRYLGPLAMPEHEPTLDNALRNERAARGAYAIFVLADKRVRCEYVDAPTIQGVRGMSERPDALMWTKFWTEGWRKVAVRRAAKLAMQGANLRPEGVQRMAAAEETIQDDEGVLDEKVPRGTPGSEPRSTHPARGMGGLRDRMAGAATRTEAAKEPTELAPAAAVAPTLLALPAPSKHPEGSIEWWLDQVIDADSETRMDEIKVGALRAGLDSSDDADTFREAFKRRRQALRTKEPA